MFAKNRGLTRKTGPPVHDDLVTPRFTATVADRRRRTDVTEQPTSEGKLFLQPHRRILGRPANDLRPREQHPELRDFHSETDESEPAAPTPKLDRVLARQLFLGEPE
ncbi:hypothetical protein [Amycolatopsis methanolica]|uniref:hypothetical protein n=1 Tax=Amycolatopsis methanolica TaxID=1814 RepID=UPI000B034C62